jgi:ketosteroid isomerase-like protein
VEIPGGAKLRVPIMLHVAIADGRITRAEEYLDTHSVAPLVAFVQAGT